MAPRLELQTLLQELIGTEGKVYFQPPENVSMAYPCFIYELSYVHMEYADNLPYKHKKRYQVTYVSQDSDNDDILDEVLALPMCSFDRSFVVDNLHHDVFTLYF